jgi:hypothetical protein
VLTIDKDEFFTCEHSERMALQADPAYFENLALNFFRLQSKQEQRQKPLTHVMLGMLQRGPVVNFTTDCINGSYPTDMNANDLRALDWEMTMAVHKKYFISEDYKLDDLESMLKSHAGAVSSGTGRSSGVGYNPNTGFDSLFREFQMRKETWPWLQKVAQRPNLFPFSDIHGWEGTPILSMLSTFK